MTEPQNYVWCVNNKITGITIAIYYKPECAEEMVLHGFDLMVRRMPID